MMFFTTKILIYMSYFLNMCGHSETKSAILKTDIKDENKYETHSF